MVLSLLEKILKEESREVIFVPLPDGSDIVPKSPRPGVLYRELVTAGGKVGLSAACIAQTIRRLLKSKNLLRSAERYDLGETSAHVYFPSSKGRVWLARWRDRLPAGWKLRPQRIVELKQKLEEEASNGKKVD